MLKFGFATALAAALLTATPAFAQTVSIPVSEITVKTALEHFCADKSDSAEKAVCLRDLVSGGRYRIVEERPSPRISIPDTPEGYITPQQRHAIPSHSVYTDRVVVDSVMEYKDPDRP